MEKTKKVVEIYIKVRYIIKVRISTNLNAGIAQQVEHFTRNEGVVGSSPISSFFFNKNAVPFFRNWFFYGARRVPESVFRRFMWLRFPVEN